jgi:class 3 adenylate cyclase
MPVLMIILAFGILTALVVVLLALGRDGGGESVCGKCGYRVQGLPTFICPECGSDLREVGIKTRGNRRGLSRVRPVILLSIWTLIWTVVWWVGFGAIDSYFWPYRGEEMGAVELTPRSGEYRRVTVKEMRASNYRGAKGLNVPGDTWEITFRLEKERGRESVMRIEPLRGLAWSYVDSGGKVRSGANLNEAAVWGWMMDAGANAPSPAVKLEAGALAELAQETIATPVGNRRTYLQAPLELIERDGTDYAFSDANPLIGRLDFSPRLNINYVAIPLCLISWLAGLLRLRPWQKNRSRNRHRVLSILFSDIKDFTQKTEAASRGELMELLALNRRLVESAVKPRGGKIVKSIGDALLATFESATNAVLAGLEIQRRVREHNAAAVDGKKMELRVAVCTGEVVMDDGDVFGTAVNVASRVQGLANAGDVYFTESTYHAMISAEVGFVEVGERALKGIDRPVKVFRAVDVGGM